MEQKTIGITGGTGFIGSHISRKLVADGHRVVIFSRSPKPPKDSIAYALWNPDKQTIDTGALHDIDAIINLAGEGVADKRWTAAYKKKIVSSRVDATLFLHEQLTAHAPKCTAFVAASATGYYGADEVGGEPFTENDPPFTDFLADVCRRWEEATFSARKQYRTVAIRIGIVLGKEGGAFPKLAQPMTFGLMPILGSGQQMVSWIHVDDLARLFVAAAVDEFYHGVYNGVAPAPVRHKPLMQAIARVKGGVKIPVPVPAFALQIIMGDASVEVLKSCTVSSKKAEAGGFHFGYPGIEAALKEIVGRNG